MTFLFFAFFPHFCYNFGMMTADEELKQLLRENLEVSRDSFKILKKMNRARLLGSFFTFMKWVIIVGLSYGAYYYIEPYLQTTMSALNSVTSGINELKTTGQNIQSLGTGGVSMDLLKKVQDYLPKN